MDGRYINAAANIMDRMAGFSPLAIKDVESVAEVQAESAGA
jgi:hypothetical protein